MKIDKYFWQAAARMRWFLVFFALFMGFFGWFAVQSLEKQSYELAVSALLLLVWGASIGWVVPASEAVYIRHSDQTNDQ